LFSYNNKKKNNFYYVNKKNYRWKTQTLYLVVLEILEEMLLVIKKNKKYCKVSDSSIKHIENMKLDYLNKQLN